MPIHNSWMLLCQFEMRCLRLKRTSTLDCWTHGAGLSALVCVTLKPVCVCWARWPSAKSFTCEFSQLLYIQMTNRKSFLFRSAFINWDQQAPTQLLTFLLNVTFPSPYSGSPQEGRLTGQAGQRSRGSPGIAVRVSDRPGYRLWLPTFYSLSCGQMVSSFCLSFLICKIGTVTAESTSDNFSE